MKTYLFKDYTSISELRKDMLKDINDELTDVTLTSDKYQDCEILEIEDFTLFNGKDDIKASISLKGGIKEFCLRVALERGVFSIAKEKQDFLNDCFSQLSKAEEEQSEEFRKMAEIAAEKARKEAEIRKAQLAEQEKLRKEKEEQAKLLKRKEKAKQKFTDMCFEAKRNGYDLSDEDLVVGWLAKHVTRISAEIPDFLESQFIKNFGENAPKTVVSTDTKSLGGFVKKWSLSCDVSVDDTSTMPPVLQNVFKKSKKVSSVKFALNLIYNYGFKFGKTQDVNEIKSTVADENAFNIGYAA